MIVQCTWIRELILHNIKLLILNCGLCVKLKYEAIIMYITQVHNYNNYYVHNSRSKVWLTNPYSRTQVALCVRPGVEARTQVQIDTYHFLI